MRNTRKYVAEFLGTMILVIFGCGTAVAINKLLGTGALIAFSTILVAFAFGLVLMALIHVIGKVSGCHVNPAVSLGMVISKRMDINEFIKYVISQCLGAIVGTAVLVIIFNSNSALAANGFDELSALGVVWYRAFLVELIATAVFVLTVLSVTADGETSNNRGLIIGLTLTLVHIFAIPFTGAGINPARSLGPAIFTGGLAMKQVWLIIIAQIFGAIIGSLMYKFVVEEKKEKKVTRAK